MCGVVGLDGGASWGLSEPQHALAGLMDGLWVSQLLLLVGGTVAAMIPRIAKSSIFRWATALFLVGDAIFAANVHSFHGGQWFCLDVPPAFLWWAAALIAWAAWNARRPPKLIVPDEEQIALSPHPYR